MNRSHHTHYFPANIDPALKLAVVNGCMKAPAFIGQGWSQRLWSDTVGGYVVAIEKTSKGKPLIGLVRADTEMEGRWEEGTEKCFLPNSLEDPKLCKAEEWITTYGKFKNGDPKWWFCDMSGKRFPGKHCFYDWNGASSYRDPSF